MKDLNLHIRMCGYAPVFEKYDDFGHVVGTIDKEEAEKETERASTHARFKGSIVIHGKMVSFESTAFDRKSKIQILGAFQQVLGFAGAAVNSFPE